jgi:thiosulfate/3-mercaptopyruvate sulfurtransferase
MMNRDQIFIEVDELLTKLDDHNLRIYDATILFFQNESDPETAYEKYLQGHIPGAAFFEHQDFSDANNKYEYMSLDGPDLLKQFSRIGISQETEVIFYAAGILPSATRAWWLLRYVGHNNVRVLNGGLEAWVQAGGELEQEARQYPEANFEGQLRPEMFAGKEEVLSAMEDSRICTEYTLPPAMYGGASIPGSTFISSMDLMEEMASFLPDEAFIDRLKEQSGYERIITYCGGGIAATVNAIAHLIAGNENVSVYDGSLIEWTGEGLPIAQNGEA